MSILNVDKIQPIGGGSTITVSATDIQATSATITAASLVIPEYITHIGDTNTKIGFSANDTFQVQTGGSARLTVTDASTTIVGLLDVNGAAVNYPLKASGTANAKVLLTGASSPYIQWQEGTTNRAYAWWDSGNNRFELKNEQESTILRLDSIVQAVTSNYFEILETGGSNANGARLNLKFGNNNTTDVISSITFSNSTGEAARIQAETSGANNSGLIAFYTDNAGTSAERMRINKAGRLLLGTTIDNVFNGNRNARFQQEGLNAADAAFALCRHSADTGPAFISLGKTRGTSLASNTAVQNGDGIGCIEFNAGDGSGALNTHAKIIAEVDGAPGNSDAPGRIAFYTTPDGGSTTPAERLRINNNGQILVGTTAHWGSDVKLHLANSGNTYLTITSGTSNNGVLAFSDDGTERGSIDYDHNGDHMLFKTSAAERLRIDSSGRIGIDYTPGSGDGPFNVDVTGSNNIFHLGHGSNNDNYYTTGASGTQTFRTPSADQLIITSAGLVTNKGTWTNTYAANDTTQCGYQTQNLSNTTNTYAALRLTAGSSSPATAQIASIRTGTGQNDLTFQLESSNTAFEALRITSGGALLVGTASPTYNSGDMQHEIKKDNNRTYTAPVMTGHAHLLLNNSDTTTNAFCGIGFRAGSADGSIGYVFTGSANSADFVINTDGGSNGAERVRITNEGKAGFNGMNPGSSDETVAIQEPSGGAVAAVTLSHLSGGNRHGCKFETISGANQGVRISSRFNSTYTERFTISGSTTTIREDTNKNIRFTGGIGEIGNVTGFQATNDANSALTDFGIRATTIRFATGGAERLRIQSDKVMTMVDIKPNTDGSLDLGASGARWDNVFINDLDLSNESKKDTGGNDVDGTWGSYVIQEGENDLFLINKRSGKKYKFNLTEIS